MTPSSRRLAFVQFDVFTTRPLEGDPLAVFLDGRGLSDDEMQAIAREMNLSETTFIFPRDSGAENARGVRVRIFTVQEELPFAGHPNVGPIPVRFEEVSGEPAFGEMTQAEPTFGQVHDRKKIAQVSGIPLEDIDTELPIQRSRPAFPLPFSLSEAWRPFAGSRSTNSVRRSI